VRSDVLEGSYSISFKKREHIDDNFYLDLLPITVQVVPFNSLMNEEAYIDIKNAEYDTIGFPIVFPIEINIKPANLMLLHI